MENFVQNVKRLQTLMCYEGDVETWRTKFVDLSDDDFYLIHQAAALQFSYQYERKSAPYYD